MMKESKKGLVAVDGEACGSTRDEDLREVGKVVINHLFRDNADGLDRIREIDAKLSRRADLRIVGGKED